MQDYIHRIEHEVLERLPKDEYEINEGPKGYLTTFGEIPAYPPGPCYPAGPMNPAAETSMRRPDSQLSQRKGPARTPLGSLPVNALARPGSIPRNGGSAVAREDILEIEEDGEEGDMTMTGFWRPNRFVM